MMINKEILYDKQQNVIVGEQSKNDMDLYINQDPGLIQ